VQGDDIPETTGTGIGLTFARRLIEKHKGTITVKSDPGQWTTFTIRFPAARHFYAEDELVHEGQQQVKENIRLEPIMNKESMAHSGKGRKLLIVEDNEELKNYLKDIFAGYDVLTASDGKEGLEKVMKELPELIISDIMMRVYTRKVLNWQCLHIRGILRVYT
jgi:hypothetical protein